MNLLQRHPRLATALALGIAAALVPFRSAEADSLHLHFLIGWNVTVWTYLALIGWLMVHAGHERARAISEGEDPSAILALMLVLLMVVASLIAIGMELARASSPVHYANAAVTLLGSWLMLNTLFTFHYAHLYFRALARRSAVAISGQSTAGSGLLGLLFTSRSRLRWPRRPPTSPLSPGRCARSWWRTQSFPFSSTSPSSARRSTSSPDCCAEAMDSSGRAA